MTIVRLGTDCSGIDSPLCALMNALSPCNYSNIRYCFASENDRTLYNLLKQSTCVVRPEIVYDDVTTRNHEDAPEVDLYVAGSPCQSFSATGKQRGLDDIRGAVIFSVIDYISIKEPSMFILENVSTILTQANGNTWKVIKDRMDKGFGGKYKVEYKCISPHEFGYPQTRKRVFVVGRHLNKLGIGRGTAYDFPWKVPMDSKNAQISARQNLEALLLSDEVLRKKEPSVFRPLAKSHLKTLGEAFDLAEKNGVTNFRTELYIVRLGVSSSFVRIGSCGICPCITRRCSTYYIMSQKRFLSSREMLMIQGFPNDYEVVKTLSTSQTFNTTGNAMHVGVMHDLIEILLRGTNFEVLLR